MTDQAKVLPDLMGLEARGHLLCSSVEFFLRCKTLVSKCAEDCTSIASSHDNSGLESQEDKSLDKQPVLEIEIPTLHYNRAVGSYQQTTAAKKARRISLVETAIHFRRSLARCGELSGHRFYGLYGLMPTTHRC